MIELAELPFAFAKNGFFEEYIQNALNPQFKRISRNDAIRLWQREKENITNYLTNSPARIAITTDLWKARGDDSFLCITAHNIDGKWVTKKRIITFAKLEWPHTSQRIEMKSLIILEKVLSVTFYNATNNKVAIELMKTMMSLSNLIDESIFQNRCVCYILNLIAQVGLKHNEIITEKIIDIAGYIFLLCT